MKIDSAVERRRLGEGAIGVALWKWQMSNLDQIYVTIYSKHEDLIEMFEKYGFERCGKKLDELVLVKDKKKVRYDTPYCSFPYLNPNFSRGKYIPIYDTFHDSMFQYSDLMNTVQVVGEMPVSNGITKNYLAAPTGKFDYKPGDIAFIYRKYTGDGPKGNKSVVTSYCTVSNVTWVKKGNEALLNFDDYRKRVGNKSVYNDEVLESEYCKSNLCLIELIYNGYFGAGHNVTYNDLKDSGLFETYPYEIELNRNEILKIMKKGGKDEHDIIVS